MRTLARFLSEFVLLACGCAVADAIGHPVAWMMYGVAVVMLGDTEGEV